MLAPRAARDNPAMNVRVLRLLLLDIALWSIAPAGFLCVYLLHFGYPASAVAPHATIVAVLWMALATLRVGLRLALPERVALPACAVLLGSSTFALTLYYALVVIGLTAWGKVVSWELIESYLQQAPMVAEALSLSLSALVAALGIAWAAACLIAWLLLRRADWTEPFAQAVSRPLLTVGTSAGIGLVILLMAQFEFASIAWSRAAEPLSLTAFPQYGSVLLQSHRLSMGPDAAQRDAREDAARSAMGAPEPRRAARNLVVIVVDALRPDHMGVYGYARNTTPWLSEQQREGRLARVDGLRAVCGESSCGLLALFTSRYMHEMPSRPITLHQALSRQGWRTHAILGGNHSQFYGLAQLYAGVDSFVDGGTLRQGEPESTWYVNDDRFVLDRTARLPAWDGTPTMLQFHLMSAHQLGRRETPGRPWGPAKVYYPGVPNSVELAVNWYDNGVAQTDDMIRRLVATLHERGYLRDALVVVTADHGEALGEHGLFTHANSVRDPVLRVPLLLMAFGEAKLPALHSRRAASQIDVAPTLLSALGVRPPATWSGRSLTEPAPAGLLGFQQGPEVGLIDTRDPGGALWKYWVDTRSGAEKAFDLARDPGENVDRLAELTPSRRREYRLDVMARTPGSQARKRGDIEF